MGFIGCYLRVDKKTGEAIFNSEDTFEKADDEMDKEEAEYLDIEHLWDGLHFLFNGVTAGIPVVGNPLSEAIVGVETKYEEDSGFFGLTYAENVKRISQALDAVDIETYLKKADFKKFSDCEIYPNNWLKNRKSSMQELRNAFNSLKTFYHETVQANKAILVCIF